jgi:hypothetical protein
MTGIINTTIFGQDIHITVTIEVNWKYRNRSFYFFGNGMGNIGSISFIFKPGYGVGFNGGK